jgi:AraC-like DNA-binding protein
MKITFKKEERMKERRFDAGTISYRHFYDEKKQAKKIRAHCHDRYEILYVSKGSGIIVIEGIKYPINPKTLIVLPPLTCHYIDIEDGSEYERYIAMFHSDDVFSEMGDILKAFDCDSVDDTCFYADVTDDNGLLSAFARFTSEVSLPEYERSQYYRFILSELILYVSAVKNRREYKRNESELGARVIRYLSECVTKNTSLEHLEKYFFVTRHYLCRAFKKHNGISIHGYITEKRIMYAKKLIDKGETAYVAADKVGYSDYSAFYRAYLKIVGKSPTSKKREEAI